MRRRTRLVVVVAVAVLVGLALAVRVRPQGIERVVWTEGSLIDQPVRADKVILRAEEVSRRSDLRVVVGDEGSFRTATVVRGDDELVLSLFLENVRPGEVAGTDEVTFVGIDDSAAAVRVFRDGGTAIEDDAIVVDPLSSHRIVVVLGEDVRGVHVLDADGRVIQVVN